jgi:hypothetical protein
VRLVQRSVEHLLAWRSGEPVEKAWRDCTNAWDAWRQFTTVTGAALKDFHVRVYVETGHQPSEEYNIGDVYTTLYSVAMLQLVNDLSADETFRTCANETCRRTFIRQLGRSRYYSRSEGVRYCTRTCANQQTQRDYYRRKRAERTQR